MATRLRVKNKKRNRDIATAYEKAKEQGQDCKIATSRSKKIKAKKANRSF